jgi:hypothetical protein
MLLVANQGRMPVLVLEVVEVVEEVVEVFTVMDLSPGGRLYL